MPFIHPERRMAGGGALSAFDDELALLYANGVRAVVSLLNLPGDLTVYNSAGFEFLCLPVMDGSAPTFEETKRFIRFVRQQSAAKKAVAVHCEAGIGRTGTLLAAYLIGEGDSAETAILKVRAIEGRAIETARQQRFLEDWAVELRQRSL